jgi:hypothetical protein
MVLPLYRSVKKWWQCKILYLARNILQWYDSYFHNRPVFYSPWTVNTFKYGLVNFETSLKLDLWWTMDKLWLHIECVSETLFFLTLHIHNFFFFQNRLYIHALGSGQREATLPLDVGTVSGYSGKKLQSEVCTCELWNIAETWLMMNNG